MFKLHTGGTHFKTGKTLFIFDIYISKFSYQHVDMLFQETLANRLMEIYCRSHVQLEGDSYHI